MITNLHFFMARLLSALPGRHQVPGHAGNGYHDEEGAAAVGKEQRAPGQDEKGNIPMVPAKPRSEAGPGDAQPDAQTQALGPSPRDAQGEQGVEQGHLPQSQVQGVIPQKAPLPAVKPAQPHQDQGLDPPEEPGRPGCCKSPARPAPSPGTGTAGPWCTPACASPSPVVANSRTALTTPNPRNRMTEKKAVHWSSAP